MREGKERKKGEKSAKWNVERSWRACKGLIKLQSKYSMCNGSSYTEMFKEVMRTQSAEYSRPRNNLRDNILHPKHFTNKEIKA